MALTLREEIVVAITEGFILGEVSAVHTVEHDDATDVYTSMSVEPITVWRDELDIPEDYPSSVAAGISLDVRSIIAMDQMDAEKES